MTVKQEDRHYIYDNWREIIAPYKQANAFKAIFQIFSTLIPLMLCCVASYHAISFASALDVALFLLSSVVGGVLLVRVFIILHDCGHNSFFNGKKLNDLVGGVIGVLVLTPCAQWSREHAKHHATTGNLTKRGHGDVLMLTVKEYKESSTFSKICYRIYRNPLFLFTLGSWFHFMIKQRAPFDVPLKDKKSWSSVIATNIGIVVTFAFFASIFSAKTVALVYVPMMMVGASVGTWIFYMQHQYEDSYWEQDEHWNHAKASIEGSSFYDLPKILHWFSGNIGYHHIHHLSSKIPNYNLPKCYEENESFKDVTSLTLKESLSCAGLALWDEQSNKLVPFAGVK